MQINTQSFMAVLFCLLALLMSACGGGTSGGPSLRPAPDFSLSVSPASVSVIEGGAASAPVNCGYQYSLDTTLYPNGPHDIVVVFTDSSGNAAPMPTLPVDVNN